MNKKEIAKEVLKNGEGWIYGICAVAGAAYATYFGIYAIRFGAECIKSNIGKIEQLKINND